MTLAYACRPEAQHLAKLSLSISLSCVCCTQLQLEALDREGREALVNQVCEIYM